MHPLVKKFTSLKMNGWNLNMPTWKKKDHLSEPNLQESGFRIKFQGCTCGSMIFPCTLGLDPSEGRPLWLEDRPHEGVRCDKTTLPTCTHLFLLSTAMFLRSQLLRVLFAFSTAKKKHEESCKLKCLLCSYAIIQRIPRIAEAFPPSHPTSNIRRKSHKI